MRLVHAVGVGNNAAAPKSYAFAVTVAFTAVVQFDATGTKTKLVFKHAYGK